MEEATEIPGLIAVYTNDRVQAIRKDPWPQFLFPPAKEGERVMIDLLLDVVKIPAQSSGSSWDIHTT